MTTYFLVPVYNEEYNLEELFSNLSTVLSGQQKFYVFSDDGSTDNSVSLLKKILPGDRSVILGDGKNYGPGHAFNMGFEWIISHSQNDTDRIVTIESDNTSNFEILDRMFSISTLGYNLVLASIYAQGGGFDKTTFFRKFISFCANILLRFIFNIKVLTLSSFYRVYQVSLIREIKKKHHTIIEESGFISMIEILIKSIKVNAQIIEVPMVLYSERRIGKSKMKKLKTLFQYLRFLIKHIF